MSPAASPPTPVEPSSFVKLFDFPNRRQCAVFVSSWNSHPVATIVMAADAMISTSQLKLSNHDDLPLITRQAVAAHFFGSIDEAKALAFVEGFSASLAQHVSPLVARLVAEQRDQGLDRSPALALLDTPSGDPALVWRSQDTPQSQTGAAASLKVAMRAGQTTVVFPNTRALLDAVAHPDQLVQRLPCELQAAWRAPEPEPQAATVRRPRP